MQIVDLIETGTAALLWVVVFLVGSEFYLFRMPNVGQNRILSFGAGMSVAYVFVHMIPELHEVRGSFVESVSQHLPLDGMVVYFFALVGFLSFYILDQIGRRLRSRRGGTETNLAFRLHIGGFAVYIFLMAYLLVDSLNENRESTALYALAISVHFLSVAQEMRGEPGSSYQRMGRFVLAGMCVLGWAIGLAYELPHLPVAAISGPSFPEA